MDERQSQAGSKKELRNFAIILCAALLILGAIFFAEKNGLAVALWGLASLLLVAGLVRPGILGPFYRVWMTLASALGFVTTHVLLAAMFYFVFAPIGAVMRFLGKGPLQKKIERNKQSYWVKRAKQTPGMDRFGKMY